jgi:A/G-specific adenine glycosylase
MIILQINKSELILPVNIETFFAMAENLQLYSQIMQQWFAGNYRKLPWRETNDPYLIWISETILQQTRISQGLDYYLRFTARFPDVQSLAAADVTEVLRLWQGLGYYSRARNLHFAARQIITDFDGKFPTQYINVRELKGVGKYTAAAICSIAYNQPFAVVDGNVYRVLSRLFNEPAPIDTTKGVKIFADLADRILDKKAPASHNQSIMEFGALQCKPVSPDCKNCVLRAYCRGFEANTITSLPVKEKKTKVSERFFNYLVIKEKEFIFINKRTENDIWRGLYDFPSIEAERLFSKDEIIQNREFNTLFEDIDSITINYPATTYKHILTHRTIFAQFIEIEITKPSKILENKYIKINISNLTDFPMPRLIEKYFENRI